MATGKKKTTATRKSDYFEYNPELWEPKEKDSLALELDGKVYIVDTTDGRVTKEELDGKLCLTILSNAVVAALEDALERRREEEYDKRILKEAKRRLKNYKRGK